MTQNVTDVSTFTAPIVTPIDGDPQNAASVLTPVQGLSNRTRNLKDRIDPLAVALGGAGGTGEWTYQNAPRARSIYVGPTFGMSADPLGAPNAWFYQDSDATVRSNVDAGILVIDLNQLIRDGMTLQNVVALVQPGAVGGVARMGLEVVIRDCNFATPTAPALVTPGVQLASGTTALQRITFVSGTLIAKAPGSMYYARLYAHDDSPNPFVNDTLYGWRFDVLDPGPRNF